MPTLRDMARFGEAIRNDERIGEVQLLPAAPMRAIREGETGADALHSPHPTLPAIVYRSQWWRFDNGRRVLSARGIH